MILSLGLPQRGIILSEWVKTHANVLVIYVHKKPKRVQRFDLCT